MAEGRPEFFIDPVTGVQLALNPKDGTIMGVMPVERIPDNVQPSMDKFDLSQFAVSTGKKTISEQLGYTNTSAAITPSQVTLPPNKKLPADPVVNLVNGNTFTVATDGNASASFKVQPFQTASYGKFDDPNGLKIVGTLGQLIGEANLAVANGTIKKNQQLSPVFGVQFDKTTSLKASFTPKGALTQVEGEFTVGKAAVNAGVKGFEKQTQTAFMGFKGSLSKNISAGIGIAVDLNTPKVNPVITGGVKLTF
jgi:hypothetical protein